jgi:hypothetical protein
MYINGLQTYSIKLSTETMRIQTDNVTWVLGAVGAENVAIEIDPCRGRGIINETKNLITFKTVAVRGKYSIKYC